MTDKNIDVNNVVDATEMFQPKHGNGRLRRGGKPGNRGGTGRPPQSVYAWAELTRPKAQQKLAEALDDPAVPLPTKIQTAWGILRIATRAEERAEARARAAAEIERMDRLASVLLRFLRRGDVERVLIEYSRLIRATRDLPELAAATKDSTAVISKPKTNDRFD